MGLESARKSVQPQQLLQADVLNNGDKFTAIMQPRRATKTSGLLAWLVGECLSLPELMAAFSICTTGKSTRSKFIKELVPALERAYPHEESRPFKILRGAGAEMVRFHNGSMLAFVAPTGDSFRSEAFDIVVLDEAQELEPEDGADLMAAILPTLDTRPDAQVVIAGTAGEFREGNLLHDYLERGREGLERHGILAYHADLDLSSLEVLTTWEDVRPIVERCHPGVASGLTPIDAVMDNWRQLRPDRFAREYLGIFGEARASNFVPWEKWAEHADTGDVPAPPDHFRFALAVHPLSTSASIVAAWRVENVPQLLVLRTGPGIGWAYEECVRLSRRYGVPVVYDSGQAANTAIADRFQRARPKVKTEPLGWGQVSTAAALLHSEMVAGKVHHWSHPAMDQAVRDVIKRGSGDSKRWAFGRPHDEADITTLEAGAAALKAYDDAPAPRQRLTLTA